MNETPDIHTLSGCAGASLFYAIVACMLSVPFVIGECLPRDQPATAICDAQKQLDLGVYAALLFINPLVAGLLAWKKSARVGSRYMLASSLMPFLVVWGINLAR